MGSLPRWTPARELSKQEERLLARLGRVRKLLGFLRRRRHELIDDAFQSELEGMYRRTGAGREPVPPGLMAMAMLVQGYLGVSDAEMIELTVVDLRVQLVLGCLGAAEPPFAQGTFQGFRERMIAHDLDRRLLERTVELARDTKEFDWKKLPKTLRVAIDSSPLEGAGRVEDTFNLLGHAARKVAECAASLLDWPVERVCREAGCPVLLAPSVKAGLDIDWNDASEKADAIKVLTAQLDDLKAFLAKRLPEELANPPLKDHVETLDQIRGQNLEPDPKGGGERIRKGVAEDRRVSVEDPQMRHGRKTKTKSFNGYKRHIAANVDAGLILACAVTPANRPEEEAAPALQEDLQLQGLAIGELLIDRGYVNSTIVDEVLTNRGDIVCKPWNSPNGSLFPKAAFRVNMRDRTVTCPAGQTQSFELGTTVEFDADLCAACPLREKCTSAELGHGRTVSIAENERLQQRLRRLQGSRAGRARLRERTEVEHRLAHLSRRQGRRARYKGTRKNTFDVRRAAAIQNLETIHLRQAEAQTRRAA
jgi:Transposase DDE domain/Transposase domain (DUF772)